MSSSAAEVVWQQLDDAPGKAEASPELVRLLRSFHATTARWNRSYEQNQTLESYTFRGSKLVFRLLAGKDVYLHWVDPAAEWLVLECQLSEYIGLPDSEHRNFVLRLRSDRRIAPDGLPEKLQELESYNLQGKAAAHLDSVQTYELHESWISQILKIQFERENRIIRTVVSVLGVLLLAWPVLHFALALKSNTLLLAPHFPVMFVSGLVAMCLAYRWNQI